MATTSCKSAASATRICSGRRENSDSEHSGSTSRDERDRLHGR